MLKTMAVKEKQGDSTEEIDWNPENELQLFYSMNGHKPVGVNKYFHMVCIWEKFRAAVNKDVSLKAIWDHLETMYDLVALDDVEDLPFPSSEVDFTLPESEFMELMKNRQKEDNDIKQKEQKDKIKEIKKEKDIKDTPKKDIITREQKTPKEAEKKKEEIKKIIKETDIKKEKQRDVKEIKKDTKTLKEKGKGKEDPEEIIPALAIKKERKDSETSREPPKRIPPKRPTRQSIDNATRASTSPRDTPPLPKRRRL
ncbi:hypothetical protein HCN44_005042 [Aphidius gifuensis]|uniref:MRG-binding protein n=1 Tax=Aphidius gifuensis TaxID=684658 RepID=A0A834XSL4_APHGI|nr:MRG/MORF4L-binding protein isoform X2 [Aphidius gifuensis]KAF7992698.1 hypothetical protein HCN44_005042 [Aphidius gifuensis]